jgi:imidazolonepropionase-like amidohydrolase
MTLLSLRNARQTGFRLGLFLLILAGFSAVAQAQTQQVLGLPPGTLGLETGKFVLHKFQQPIGEETYEIRRDFNGLELSTNFKFTDRGSPVPLTASMRMWGNYVPLSFTIKGNTARGSTIDTHVDITGQTATIREGANTRTATVPRGVFTIAGYAPTAVQMVMMRYFTRQKLKGSLPTVPGGAVTIEKRGIDRVPHGTGTVELTRYIITGLIWGRESVWLDKNGDLVALVGLDAEFDHFESIREGYEGALNTFVSRAAEDGMAALSELSRRISPATKGTLAIVNANVIDGTGAAPVMNAAVVIENGRITAVGPRASITIPKNAQVFDAGGKYLLPGLWDMHAHFAQVEWGPVYLAAGVTTVRDVGNEFDFIRSIRDAVQNGRGLGPRMLLAGIIDGESPSAIGIIRADTPDQGRAAVNKYKDAGFDQIKIYSSIKPDVLKAICDEAHRLGLTVTGHIPRGMNAIQGVEAGMDQINHISYLPTVFLPAGYQMKPTIAPPPIDFNSPESQKTIRFFQDHHTVFDPTIALYEWILHPSNVPFAQIEPGAANLPPELIAPINNSGMNPQYADAARANRQLFIETIRALHRAGLTIVAGTDQAVPGHSLKRELELYVEAGFTPMEAIQAATIVPARVMKRDKEVGTVEAGKIADLILVEGNPLDNISNLRKTSIVVTNGRMFECAKLWQSVGFKP